MCLGMSLLLGLGRKYASVRRNPYELDLLSGSSALRGNKFLREVQLLLRKCKIREKIDMKVFGLISVASGYWF